MSKWCSMCYFSDRPLNNPPCNDCDRYSKSDKQPSHFGFKPIKTDINYEEVPKEFYEVSGVSPVALGQGVYETLGQDIGKLVDEKNLAYGDSVNTSAEAFKLLFPDGIKPEQYSDALLLVRIWDKMKRIATKKGAFDESPFKDIVGYGILGAKKDEGGNK